MTGPAACAPKQTTKGCSPGLAQVANQLRETATQIDTAIEQAAALTDAQIASSFGQLGDGWQREMSQLETLKPPAKLTTDFNTLTDSSRRVETDLTAIVSAAHTHSKSAAEQAGASLVTDVLSAKAVSTKLTDQLGIK